MRHYGGAEWECWQNCGGAEWECWQNCGGAEWECWQNYDGAEWGWRSDGDVLQRCGGAERDLNLSLSPQHPHQCKTRTTHLSICKPTTISA
jgi:hypothetical protein